AIGAIALDAHSKSDAKISQTSPINVGAIDLGFVKSTAEAGGATHAFIDQGGTIIAKGLSAKAFADNHATVDKFQLAAAFFKLDEAKPVARTTHDVAAYIGPAAGVAPNAGLNGTITTTDSNLVLDATAINTAMINDVKVEVSGIGVGLMDPTMEAGGT